LVQPWGLGRSFVPELRAAWYFAGLF
jgi:hypothetical protein